MYKIDKIVENVEEYVRGLSDREFVDSLIDFLVVQDSSSNNNIDPEDNALLYDGELFDSFVEGYNRMEN